MRRRRPGNGDDRGAPQLVPDPYRSGEHLWWHLSEPSPELSAAVADGWLWPPGRVLDLGCGLGTEAAHLAARGFEACGVDISEAALRDARGLHAGVSFVRADVTALPFRSGAFDYALDRGTFHYLTPAGRFRYASEAARVVRSGGRLLLRACLHSRGVRNDVDEQEVRTAFQGWSCVDLRAAEIPSDTRSMPALLARLERA